MRSRIPGAFDYYEDDTNDDPGSYNDDGVTSSLQSTDTSVPPSSLKPPYQAYVTSKSSSDRDIDTINDEFNAAEDNRYGTALVYVGTGQSANETEISESRLRQQSDLMGGDKTSRETVDETGGTDGRCMSDLMSGGVWTDMATDPPSAPISPHPASAETTNRQSWWQRARSRWNRTAATDTTSPDPASSASSTTPSPSESEDQRSSQPPPSGTGLSFYLKATAAVLAASVISYYTVGAGGGSTFRQGGETTDFLDIASNITRMGLEGVKWAVPRVYEGGAWAASRVVEGSTWAGPRIMGAAGTALSGASGWWDATRTAATGLG